MNRHSEAFDRDFESLSGFGPFCWQRRLFQALLGGSIPSEIDLPTGLGKTSVMTIWLIARAYGAKLPRRLVYVVDRRAVVDQATHEAEMLRNKLEQAPTLKSTLGLANGDRLPISTLRGAHIDNREWLDNPSAAAIIVGTVDMIGSRLLFSGYGVSRKMRPYQAGLLGIDAMVVLDESHLVPPFAHLLRAIEQDKSLHAVADVDRALLPRFVFLPLSATQRTTQVNQDRQTFSLAEEDWTVDAVVKQRLRAGKNLRLQPFDDSGQDRQLAEAAWSLATKEGACARVVVFCDRRDKTEGSGPSAEGVRQEIERLAKSDRRTGRVATGADVEFLVGSRRIREREDVARWLHRFGFIGKKETLERPAFVVATSAGEVGIDIDADHMVCDLTSWERMVQRLGRVNRRGLSSAEVRLFWKKPAVKDAGAPTDGEKRALMAFASKAVIERLPQVDGMFDASSAALRNLGDKAKSNAELEALIAAATTPEPLRPAINRALVDAWSMTSLLVHPGRADVAPWLRGWQDDDRRTTVIWRAHLPLRVEAHARTVAGEADVNSFFEAAPPHESEKLETETHRVADWLEERSGLLLERDKRATTRSIALDLQDEDVVALVLASDGTYAGHYTLRDLGRRRKGGEKSLFQDKLVGRIVVLDVRFGGLDAGMLRAAADGLPETADGTEAWSGQAGFRVRRSHWPMQEPGDPWRFEDHFVVRRDDEGQPLEVLAVDHFKDAAQSEDARSISRPQELDVHEAWTRMEMMAIASVVGLAGTEQDALAIAASLHDEGKRAKRWQQAFQAERDQKKCGLVGPLAKTRGPIQQRILGHYRHEFGSLRYVEQNPEFQGLSADWKDLVLHLVAAHHGQARPLIDIRGCEDGPPSILEGRAQEVALRFARLQKRWGPWGLAWWEAILRAADARASRANDEGAGSSGGKSDR